MYKRATERLAEDIRNPRKNVANHWAASEVATRAAATKIWTIVTDG